MAISYGTYHLADNPQLFEPARSNNFEFVVTDIDNLLQAGVSEELAQDNDYIKNGQDIIRLSVVSYSVPHFTLSEIPVQRGNNTMYFAGVPSFESGTLKVNDYIGARTKDALLAWQALAYDVNTEKVHTSDKYKKNCQLIEYSPDYEEIIRTWDLKGCWITKLSEGDFNNEQNEKRTVEATIRFDKAIPHKPDVEEA